MNLSLLNKIKTKCKKKTTTKNKQILCTELFFLISSSELLHQNSKSAIIVIDYLIFRTDFPQPDVLSAEAKLGTEEVIDLLQSVLATEGCCVCQVATWSCRTVCKAC